MEVSHVIERYDAYLFDLDGVVTPTVDLHRRAWQETFDEFFVSIGAEPYRDEEYFDALDGKPRFDGVRALLHARGIALPEGDGSDNLDTVRGIGNRKNHVFAELLTRDGIDPYPGSLALIMKLIDQQKPLAIVSSSRNAEPVLRAAKLWEQFPTIVDGMVAAREQLPGKPAPDTFIRAAELLGVPVERAVVFEDAVSGVEAGRAGGFGLVVGVNRGAGAEALTTAGADIVVNDLEELL